MKDNNDEMIKFSNMEKQENYDDNDDALTEEQEFESDLAAFDVPEDDEEEFEQDGDSYEDANGGEDNSWDDRYYDDQYYDDKYYDDKINKVLDELAELKKGMTPAPQSPSQPIIVPIPQNNGGDAIMYNEISRLREELGKTQNTQSLHLELSRLKEEMKKDKKRKDATLLAEIKRLNDRIEVIQQDNKDKAVAARAIPQSEGVWGVNLDKIMSANDSILRNAHDLDIKYQAEVNAIKSKLDALPNFDELNKSIISIRNSIQALDDETIDSDLSDKIDVLKRVLTSSPAIVTANAAQNDAISENLQEIRSMLADLSLNSYSDASDEDDEKFEPILSEFATIKASLEEIAAKKDTSDAINQLQAEYIDITSKLADLADQLSTARVNEEGVVEVEPNNHMNEQLALTKKELAQPIFDDLAIIRQKLEQQDEFITQIDDLRSEISTLNNSKFDEIKTLLDELTGADMSAIMDELYAIKEKLGSIDEYDTVAEILSLREDVKAARIVDSNDVSTELESLKNNLSDIKSDLAQIKTLRAEIVTSSESAARVNDAVPSSDEVNMLLSEIVSLRDEIQSYKDDVTNYIAAEKDEPTELAIAADGDHADNITAILDELANLRADFQDYKDLSSAEKIDELDALKDNILEIKNMISRRTTLVEQDIAPAAASNELNVVLDEIINLKNELDALKEQTVEVSGITAISEDLQSVKTQLADIQINQAINYLPSDETESPAYKAVLASLSEIKRQLDVNSVSSVTNESLFEEILGLRNSIDAVSSANNESVNAAILDEFTALREEISSLKQQLAENSAEPDNSVLTEVMSLREEINSLKQQIHAPQQAVTSDVDMSVLTEVLSLRDELSQFKNSFASSQNSSEMAETIDAINRDVKSIKDEPDLSVVNEILALRDEFQAIKEELSKVNAPKDDVAREELMKEVKSLRDQLFAISMASVSDGTSSEATYQSYNNIILDEISALRDEMGHIKNSDDSKNLSDEIAKIKEKISVMAEEEKEALISQFAKLKSDIDALQKDKSDASNNTILAELNALKQQIASKSDADETSANFIAEMARAIEKQNNLISEASNDKLIDEIASLKAQIANFTEKEQA